jgi:hypothetical protein
MTIFELNLPSIAECWGDSLNNEMLGKTWKEAEMTNIRLEERKETRNISIGIVDSREDFRTHDVQNMKEKCQPLHLRHLIFMSELTNVDSVCNFDPERQFHS